MEDSSKIFYAIADTLIEEFSITAFVNENKEVQKDIDDDFKMIEKSVANFGEALDFLLYKSEKLWKIWVDVPDIPYKYAKRLADLIVKHLKLGKIE